MTVIRRSSVLYIIADMSTLMMTKQNSRRKENLAFILHMSYTPATYYNALSFRRILSSYTFYLNNKVRIEMYEAFII